MLENPTLFLQGPVAVDLQRREWIDFDIRVLSRSNVSPVGLQAGMEYKYARYA